MNINEPLLPEKYRIFSGSWLKVIAVLTMLIDHIGGYIVKQWDIVILTIGSRELQLYECMRYMGRIAFPIFCFLLIEGFIHTRSRKKYALNLFIFALISELPWNLVHSGELFCSSQNVMFTLLLGFLGLCAMERFREDKTKVLFSLLALLLTSILLKADYGCTGFAFILMLYSLRSNRVVQTVVGSCMLSSKWIAGLAFIPINMYNGKRGFIEGSLGKYLFYAFYPVHLLVIWMIIR